MTFIFDPDSPPSFDLAEVQHDLTGARSRRYGQCDSTCTVDCGHCKGAGHPASRARDVAYVNDLARRVIPPRAPGLDRPGSAGFHTGFDTGRRTDPATSLAWIGGFLCIVIAIAACGLGMIVVQIAMHWRGLGKLALLALAWCGLTDALNRLVARRHR